jgi:hypothetical protein
MTGAIPVDDPRIGVVFSSSMETPPPSRTVGTDHQQISGSVEDVLLPESHPLSERAEPIRRKDAVLPPQGLWAIKRPQTIVISI